MEMEDWMSALQGKKILIAGGTGKVGRHLVQAQLAAGATAIVPSRNAAKLDALERSIDADGRARFVRVVGDITNPNDAARVLGRAGPLDGAVASLGDFVIAPEILDAPDADLRRALDGYVVAHFAAARALFPVLRERGGGYVTINGPLAFDLRLPGAGLVSVATAAQAMLARVLMQDPANAAVRMNEVVIYSAFGWGNDDANLVSGADIGRYVAYLLSDRGAAIRGETIHLRSRDMIPGEDLIPSGEQASPAN
jgi:NAD(P)-dependent dehydrogenase (short-subunit alcohol dehydrogenase family)